MGAFRELLRIYCGIAIIYYLFRLARKFWRISRFDKLMLVKKRYKKDCYPWYMMPTLTPEEIDAFSSVTLELPTALRNLILDFAKSLPTLAPGHPVDAKSSRQMIFPHFKGPGFNFWRDGSLTTHESPLTDRGLLFGLGDVSLKNHFFRKSDFSEPGEMFCVTLLIKQAGVQPTDLYTYLHPETPLSIGFMVNYENCVRNTITYNGNGKLVHYVRTPKEVVYTQNVNGANVYFTKGCYHEIVSELQAPACHSTARTRDNKPWEMKTSLVLSGGRLWCIVDGVLYDFNFPAVRQRVELDASAQLFPSLTKESFWAHVPEAHPGIALGGQPTDLLVPLITSPAECLVELVAPDPTFTQVYVHKTPTKCASLI